MVKRVRDIRSDLDRWNQVPFPNPLSQYLEYIYAADQGADTFTLAMWSTVDGIRTPVVLEASLSEICESCRISVESLRQNAALRILDSTEDPNLEFDSKTLEPWNEPSNLPTVMTELQQQFFVDFVRQWQPWFDGVNTWRWGSCAFKALTIAILRLASWDFEVSSSVIDILLSTSHFPDPVWKFPKEEQYWFHGFFVMLQPDLESPQAFHAAVAGVKVFIDNSGGTPRGVRSILISPRHVAFVQISGTNIKCSEIMPLLTNSSGSASSPGFRVLAQVLSTDCWKPTLAHRESWGSPLSLEALSRVFHSAEPRDKVALAQASFQAEQIYYNSIPQFEKLSMQKLFLSITCCGKRPGLEESGVRCIKCRAWQHRYCVGLEFPPPDNSFICAICRENPGFTGLDLLGIDRHSLHHRRKDFIVQIDGSTKCLRNQAWKPGYFPRRARNGLSEALKINFSIRFNGTFTALAYGIEDVSH
ncbi:hypothetical protein N7457_003391 [Penicillium paradoxum]|uniref:uncharacterized protein n=1 Tax=Penicillium paradoxum TaxID=176176 RepID=UPI002549782E|nr:uncharacterized protein N7457_003391 [Penicillium paradoxum]KAJ5788401.1 hypothetical protein N7457_003391 [Penicillium paradoxum]